MVTFTPLGNVHAKFHDSETKTVGAEEACTNLSTDLLTPLLLYSLLLQSRNKFAKYFKQAGVTESNTFFWGTGEKNIHVKA